MKKETALKTVDYQTPARVESIAEAMAEEMEGLPLSFPRVRIPGGGGTVFEVPGDDPNAPDSVKEIVGVIIDHHPVNAYWSGKYAGNNNPPDCSSLDGKTGDYGPCKSCQYNQWGSGPDGRGKACKNMHRVYILREGETIPLLLTLPPTSLKNFADYLALRIVTRGLRSYSVITKIALKRVKNADGISYSQAIFSMVDKLPPEQIKAMAEFAEGIKAVTRQLSVANDEYIQSEPVQSETNQAQHDMLDDDEVPF